MTRFYLFTTGFFLSSISLFSTLGYSSFSITTVILMVCLFLLHKMVDHFPEFKKESHSIYGIVFISITLQILFSMSSGMGDRVVPVSWIETLTKEHNTLSNSFLLKTLLLNIAMPLPLYAILKKEKIPVQRVLFLTATPAIPLAALLFTPTQILMALLFCLHTSLIISGRQITGFIMAGVAVSLAPWQAATLPLLINRYNCKTVPLMILPLSAILIWNSFHGVSNTLPIPPSIAIFPANEIPVILFLLLGAIQGIIWLTVHNPVRSLFIFMGFIALLNPMATPLLIMMPLAAIFASVPWLFLCASLLFSAATIEGALYQNPEALLQTGLIYLIFAVFFFRKAWRTGPAPVIRYNRVKTISVIIPTLNEEQNIKHCIRSIYNQQEVKKTTTTIPENTAPSQTNKIVDSRKHAENIEPNTHTSGFSLPGHIHEIIVADGGSSDQTLSIAEAKGALVVNGRKGRGCQIADAMETASGDILLVLHADCTLKKDATQKILHTLNKDRTLAGGAFFMEFDPTDSKKRLISFLNNLRAAITGISFGDQGQFARKEALTKCNGFPDQMLMEDVELSLRLKNHGRLTLIHGKLTVSGRRWDTRGFSSNFTTVIRLFTTYLARRRFGFKNQNAQTYYKAYYKE